MKKKLLIIFISVVVFSFSVYAQLQSVDITTPDRGICEGDTIKLSINIGIIGTPKLNVKWTPNTNISSDIIDEPLVCPKTTTHYVVTVEDEDNGFSLADTIKITVFPRPIVNAPENDSTCTGYPYILTPQQFDFAQNPLWTTDGLGDFEGPADSMTVKYIPAPNELGRLMFILTGHAIDPACVDVFDTTYITYYGATLAEILTQDASVCSNESIEIEATAENYASFTWRHNGEGVFQNENTLTPTYVPHEKEFGNIDIILDVNGLGCDKSDTVSFYVSQMYVEYLDEITACVGDRVFLNVTSSPDYTYLWSTGETENEIVINATETEIYSVEIQNNEGCSEIAEIIVNVKENPEIFWEAVHENKQLVVSPAGLFKYEFYGNDYVLLYSGKSNIFNYCEASASHNIIYIVAFDEFGCSSDADNNYSDFYVIPIFGEVDAFSPNGDGINDLLLSGHKITVFDRTHKILYEGWNGWDGTYNGKEFPQGTYFYVVYDDDGKVFYKGPVTLLR
ncbi:MAG: T9SS type B sorting domain-containing protein [Prolixibacteraceae bacterium]|jgi:gliding motility-associated-like protein|nr:T9SS type B sorting domain-containing protein [Prolixibacteraceae bacterium]MBT6007462.1 T9SS type B sorting domain-containing protein [Prolixibacteraceae bacterium]MBT6764995.1 T9SS type B sorting domain-containing protein [Prolixibacteraceae bacterium]MBT7393294.1 T9SS type B sorting domain-containing protein [Prolixibacteraceae bacterium]